jgi:hypothetical protein
MKIRILNIIGREYNTALLPKKLSLAVSFFMTFILRYNPAISASRRTII